MGYTWDELMSEKVPRTMYSFEQMKVEGEKKKERREEMEQDLQNVQNKV